jgi:hypothetical protein
VSSDDQRGKRLSKTWLRQQRFGHYSINLRDLGYIYGEILKYEKKGFDVKKRTMKYGIRVHLKKETEGFLSSGFEGVYIYYVEGDASLDSIRDCLKDYLKFYKAEEFGEGDKGFFMVSGSVDERLFKDLKKALINDNDEIRNSIKIVSLGESSKKDVEKEQTKKEKQPDKEQEESHESKEIITKINRFALHKKPKTEKELDSMLIHFLSAFYPDIETQVAYQNARIDAKIGNIGVEIKFQPSSSEFDRLYGQVEKYLKFLDKVIVVVGFEKTRELSDSFEKRVKERGWLNNKVHVISLK